MTITLPPNLLMLSLRLILIISGVWMNYLHFTLKDFEGDRALMSYLTIFLRRTPYLILIITMLGVMYVTIDTSKKAIRLYRLFGKKEIMIDDIDSYTEEPFFLLRYRTKFIRCVLISLKDGKLIRLYSYNLRSLRNIVSYFDEP